MAVYNGGEYLRPAIDSILAQTFTDFEFIIVDDGSTDGSVDVVRTYTDSRIRLYAEPHRGFSASLNLGVKVGRGAFIARMDADDVSAPERIACQVGFLQAHPDIGLVGSWLQVFGSKSGFVQKLPVSDGQLKLALSHDNPFGHGSIMLRRALLAEVGTYRSELYPAEDFDLWLRISEREPVANMPVVLYSWRLHQTQMTSTVRAAMQAKVKLALILAVERLLSGRDRFGASLAANSCGRSTLLTFYFFAVRSLFDGHPVTCVRLSLKAIALSPRLALYALAQVCCACVVRLWPPQNSTVVDRRDLCG
jgi:cellulose synthase/poly-beta-1,6-N-acetylglucosamine synthase-like glycosyltransferase